MSRGTTPCSVCGRLMRPYQAAARDWPGTVSRAGADCCKGCYRKRDNLTVAGRDDAKTERLRASAQRRAQEQHAAAARARARAERDRRERIAALANQVQLADHTVVTVDGAGRMTATLTVPLGRYDGTTTAHHQQVARALAAFAGALARRCLRPVTSPAPVIDRARGEVMVSATVVPTAHAREVAR